MTTPICIIGTDTEIGKTYTCCQILHYLVQHNQKVAALKPIASGTNLTQYGYLNQDVYDLWQASNIKLNFRQINPLCFTQPIAPHIAAANHNINLSVKQIIALTKATINHINYTTLLIEGIGGLMVPLNEQETYLDLLIHWDYPTILVVGMKLGCLNHALLTYFTALNSKINLVGWIANCISPNMAYFKDNLLFLQAKLNIPLLAIIPYQQGLQPTPCFSKVFL